MILSPLEETLFQSWAKANRVDNHDDPNNMFDHRAHYKATNGLIHHPGHVNTIATAHNNQMESMANGGVDKVAQAQAEGQAKAQTEHLKKQDADMQNKLEIAKAQHQLKQLLIKRHLGI